MDSGYVFVYNPFATIQKVKILLLELFWLWVDLPKGFNCYLHHFLLSKRAILPVALSMNNPIAFLKPRDDLAESGIVAV